ncbi:MAG: ATP-binding protein [Spongiibacteraceae bacterium]|jgi:NtrC-family two-component system sensor histidine kinase KinB|nr:ATP-binding protein [Spongiibacteraceae bacterium]
MAQPGTSGRPAIKIKSRLLISYGAVLVIAAAGLLLGLVSVVGLSRFNQSIIENNVQSLAGIAQMRAALGLQQASLLNRIALDSSARRQLLAADTEFRAGLDVAGRFIGSRDQQARLLLDGIRASYNEVHGILTAERPAAEADLSRLFNELSGNVQALYALNLDAVEARNSASQARSIALLLALLVTATLVVGWMVSLRLARVISQPLEAMSRATSQIAIGDFNVRLQPSGIAELDNVARQFNRMAEALRHFHALNIDAIIAEQRRNEAILNSIDDGLIICDHNGSIERINPVALLQLGKTEGECIGRSLGNLLDSPQMDQRIAHTIRQGEEEEDPQPLEFQLGDENNPRILGYSIVPFQDVPESGAVMVLRDITAQRQFDNLRTEFVLRASHELRTPLTSIRMAMGLLEDRLTLQPGTRERELLDTVNDEMQRMVRLLNDLLDLSRMYARSLRFQLDTVSVPTLINQAVQRFSQAAQEAQIDIRHSCDDEDLFIQGDRVHLDRVLDNLIANALRHTPAGGNILLSCWQAGANAYISISDSGEGIPLQQQARVFEPFVQVGANAGGAGLGLSMCKEIVQQHGGAISLRSVPGRGSVFTIRLPA